MVTKTFNLLLNMSRKEYMQLGLAGWDTKYGQQEMLALVTISRGSLISATGCMILGAFGIDSTNIMSCQA